MNFVTPRIIPQPKRIMKKYQSLTIAVVSDIHNGVKHGTKSGPDALRLLRRFCDFAQENKADLILDLGDRISDIDPAQDLKHLQEIANIFRTLSIPRLHLLGNHDREHLSIGNHSNTLGASMESRIVACNGWNIVVWQANTKGFWPDGLNLCPSDLHWLQNALAQADGPCIVCSHVPLDSGSMTGNYYFSATPGHASYPESSDARKIIEESDKVVLCLAGHVHWNTLNTVAGIPYLSIHSLTESCTTFPDPSGAMALLELNEKVCWTVYGKDPVQIKFPVRKMPSSWLTPLGSGYLRDVAEPLRFADKRLFLFDLDGVFYRGDTPMPGIERVLDILEKTGRSYLMLTNNARYSPHFFSARLAKMGLAVPAEKILTSSMVLLDDLQRETEKPNVFVIGSRQFKDFLSLGGCIVSDAPSWVIVGWDDDVSMADLKKATRYLLAGAQLLAANADPLIPASEGLEPENGALIAFLERASGQTARIAGKPNPAMFKTAMMRKNATPAETVMVGDTLETDILGANYSGVQSVYLAAEPPEINGPTPALTVDSIAKLAEILWEELDIVK